MNDSSNHYPQVMRRLIIFIKQNHINSSNIVLLQIHYISNSNLENILDSHNSCLIQVHNSSNGLDSHINKVNQINMRMIRVKRVMMKQKVKLKIGMSQFQKIMIHLIIIYIQMMKRGDIITSMFVQSFNKPTFKLRVGHKFSNFKGTCRVEY